MQLPTRSPEDAGLDPAALEAGWAAVVDHTRPRPDGPPLYPGAVLLDGVRGAVVLHRATGEVRRYAHADGTLLPAAERVATRPDTIFDLASISKLFTSIATVQQVDAGLLDLDRPVVGYLPEFARGDDGVPGKAGITVRMLLTHTSGFPAFLPFWRDHPDPDSRAHAVLTARLVSAPGTAYCYSDLNLITLGLLLHRLTGRPLDALVADGITGPLGMRDTGYAPDPALRSRIAPTEEETDPPRGVVWGEVHDENAWSFAGVAGHAGVFSTAADLAVLAQVIIEDGALDGVRILSADAVRRMTTNENTGFPGHDHGLGFEIDQPWYMGRLSGPRTVGHTGFTGTSLVIDLGAGAFVVLLTNRVHPSRSWGTINPARVAAADALADALARR
ncbi:CubicO group peptidase (beta-lactamase class C family) [Friedmanniella endophytica]|uniref:CubicO group peptidase (Beta-lactamase class C family) n=1 Tax=Microlunatus kandeliicorticis TaxID=1759536 RepID=A0A7W3ISS2_9ACTN|nr:serine hydrolase domain-containing protein [Microlunatus kandeliicorticis]MBA8794500.1 CubicO group peptidase (beta-lactamase class C family) [Microlunatus kandeliicorticis]